MSLATQIQSLATRIATEFKTVKGTVGTLSSLTTTAKTDLVSAINEVKSATASAPGINDTGTSTTTAWSSSKTNTAISSAVATLVNAAPAALDTLKELSDALGGDASFATTVSTALGLRVRADTSTQGLTATQQGYARTNIAAAGSVDMGDPATDFVSTFNSGLV